MLVRFSKLFIRKKTNNFPKFFVKKNLLVMEIVKYLKQQKQICKETISLCSGNHPMTRSFYFTFKTFNDSLQFHAIYDETLNITQKQYQQKFSLNAITNILLLSLHFLYFKLKIITNQYI